MIKILNNSRLMMVAATMSMSMALATTLILGMLLLTGCGSNEPATAEAQEAVAAEASVEAVAETPKEETTAEVPAPPYFTKGVYVNYAKDAANPPKTYFYVFNGEDYGYTADGEHEGIGVPYSITTAQGTVEFSFGGADEESKDVLHVTAVDNGVICGYFESVSDKELVFEPVAGADADTFSAENYVNGPSESVYRDANGWSVKYDASLFNVNEGGPVTTFVYMGESAGTNMLTATYTIDNKGEAAIKEVGSAYGDKADYFEGTFPGTEDVKGYWVSVPVDYEGSGAYMTAVARDYMDGALIFQLDGHMGSDEENNMAVSDALAAVIDSLEFQN